MNRLITGMAVVTTLLIVQSCSLSPKATEKSANATTEQHEDHAMDGKNHAGHSMSHTDNKATRATAQVRLDAPSKITPNNPVPLTIVIQTPDGKAIESFDTFQSELMHLIVVSDDLQFFHHLHPTYKQNGRFEVEVSFPQSGGYTLFSDYKPAGKPEQVSVLKTEVTGTSPASPEIDLNRTKTFNNTKVELAFSSPTVKAGEEVTLMFNLQDTANNQLVTDLQPYLGERGHLVILQQSSSLTANNYIHAHAVKDTPTGQVHFMTSFPQPGKYKIWGQFNRNGRLVTADFWVNVV